MSTPPTVRELWQDARTILQTDEIDNRLIRAAVLLLACSQVGPSNKRLRAYTHIPMSDIARTSYYLRRAGIWNRRSFYAEWLATETDPSLAHVEFVMQAQVAAGDIRAASRDQFAARTVGSEMGCDSTVLWDQIVPRRQLKRIGGEAEQAVPWWVRRAA